MRWILLAMAFGIFLVGCAGYVEKIGAPIWFLDPGCTQEPCEPIQKVQYVQAKTDWMEGYAVTTMDRWETHVTEEGTWSTYNLLAKSDAGGPGFWNGFFYQGFRGISQLAGSLGGAAILRTADWGTEIDFTGAGANNAKFFQQQGQKQDNTFRLKEINIFAPRKKH